MENKDPLLSRRDLLRLALRAGVAIVASAVSVSVADALDPYYMPPTQPEIDPNRKTSPDYSPNGGNDYNQNNMRLVPLLQIINIRLPRNQNIGVIQASFIGYMLQDRNYTASGNAYFRDAGRGRTAFDMDIEYFDETGLIPTIRQTVSGKTYIDANGRQTPIGCIVETRLPNGAQIFNQNDVVCVQMQRVEEQIASHVWNALGISVYNPELNAPNDGLETPNGALPIATKICGANGGTIMFCEKIHDFPLVKHGC